MISSSRREKALPLLLVGALFLCHGVFGPLHLLCASPGCVEGAAHPAGHPAGHHPAAGTMGHATSAEYFAVVAGLLGLLVGLLPTGTRTKERPCSRRAIRSFRKHRVFRPARAPTSRVLQVFRL